MALSTLFLYCVNSNPGYLTKEYANEKGEYMNIASLVYNNDDIKKYCYTCEIIKPKQSKVKHCKKCNRCVCRFDHHCDFINNCVGAGNHKPFIYLIICTLTAILLTVYRIIRTSIDFYKNNGIWNSFSQFIKPFSKNWAFYSILTIVFIIDIIIFGFLSILLYQQLCQISHNITFNDVIKRERKRLIKGDDYDSEKSDEENDNDDNFVEEEKEHVIKKSLLDFRDDSHESFDSFSSDIDLTLIEKSNTISEAVSTNETYNTYNNNNSISVNDTYNNNNSISISKKYSGNVTTGSSNNYNVKNKKKRMSMSKRKGCSPNRNKRNGSNNDSSSGNRNSILPFIVVDSYLFKKFKYMKMKFKKTNLKKYIKKNKKISGFVNIIKFLTIYNQFNDFYQLDKKYIVNSNV